MPVIVPTVEREDFTAPDWSIATAGGIPSIESASGRVKRSRN